MKKVNLETHNRSTWEQIHWKKTGVFEEVIPEKLMKVAEGIGDMFEKTPLLRCVSGALFVVAKR